MPFVALLVAPEAQAQVTYQTVQYPNNGFTGVTGIRGDNITASYALSSGTGGLLYRIPTGLFTPLPVATANGTNFPNSSSAEPYGPSFGWQNGILSVVGTYVPSSGGNTLSYRFDAAAAPNQQITYLAYPGGQNTIAHSQFGTQVVGNYNTATLLGHAFVYNIATGSWTTNDKPGAASTSAYGVWGNRIAGGYTDPGPAGIGHGYIYNEKTGVFTVYDAPGASVATHFEGITAGGRAGEFNLAASSIDAGGASHAWAVHVDANGVATWTELVVPGADSQTANSIYANEAVGIFRQGAVAKFFIATVPGLYTPVTNNGTLVANTAGAAALSAVNGDDVVNNGVIVANANNSIGIAAGQYGVIQNQGAIIANGPGSVAVQLNGEFGTFLNNGIVGAQNGAFALQTGATAVGTTVVNAGVIDGQVSIAAGPFARFQNSGWMGISAPGSGITHSISGVFVQTPGATLGLRVGATTSDMLQVNGAARLAGTAQANFQPGSLGNSYTLVSATGGYTGTFDQLTTQNLPAFLSASLGYSGNNVTLNLQSGFANQSGLGGDQISVGRALDWAFNAGPGLSSMPALFTLSAGQLPGALTMLSGDSASVGLSTAFQAGGQFTSMISNRSFSRSNEQLAALPSAANAAECVTPAATACDAPSNLAFWADGFGSTQWLNADSSTGAPSSQSTVLGGAVGADYRFGPGSLVGFGAGLSSTQYWMPTNGATGWATGVHLGLYGAHEWNGFYVNGALAWANFTGNATRFVTGIGASEIERSSGVSNQLAGRVEVGRPFDISATMGSPMAITPFAAVQPAQLWTPGMQEVSTLQSGGAGVFGLNYAPQSTTSMPTFLGAQIDAKSAINARPFNFWLRASWVHEFLTDRSVSAGFTILPGTNFTVDGARAASDAARLDTGLKYQVGEQTSLFANGDVELSGRGQAIAGTIGVRFTW
jgi:uncharacterized protein with beta-barrel porin domain